MVAETAWQLITDVNHWVFEAVSDLVLGGIFGALIWPRIKRHFHRDIGAAVNAPWAEGPGRLPERLPTVCDDEVIA